MNHTARLILARHGESQWNREKRFTGWADVDLTREGIAQMCNAAMALRAAGVDFDLSYASVLRRCIRSLWILLDSLDRMWVPQVLDWRLNERHYGALTGRLRSEATKAYGEKAVRQWRRSYDAEPPPIDEAAARHVPIDQRYAALAPFEIPRTESLQRTVERVRGMWNASLAPALRAGRCVALIGHGNALRAMIKILEGVSDEGIMRLEVANGAPIVYELDSTLKPLHKRVLAVPVRRSSEIL